VIFLDSNVLLRHVTLPTSADGIQLATRAENLLTKLLDGELEATISELVIHEVGYILTSKRHYGLDVSDTVDILRGILAIPGIILTPSERNLLLRALEIWEANPVLEFADSLFAAKCEFHGWQLATFDKHFRRLDMDLFEF
jgi:predicted nucleic acid-binding protein